MNDKRQGKNKKKKRVAPGLRDKLKFVTLTGHACTFPDLFILFYLFISSFCVCVCVYLFVESRKDVAGNMTPSIGNIIYFFLLFFIFCG